MPKRRRFTFRGSDAARARALARTPRRPRFALGDVVLDAFGDIAAVEAIYADMQAVVDAGLVDDPATWRKGLEVRPKTANNGLSYALAYGHGQGVAGELDLRLAPDGAASAEPG
jgi:hypothetical protein